MNPDQRTATLKQYDAVARMDEFVDMATTKYVWARAFPTVFYPIFYNGKWVIHHNISGYH